MTWPQISLGKCEQQSVVLVVMLTRRYFSVTSFRQLQCCCFATSFFWLATVLVQCWIGTRTVLCKHITCAPLSWLWACYVWSSLVPAAVSDLFINFILLWHSSHKIVVISPQRALPACGSLYQLVILATSQLARFCVLFVSLTTAHTIWCRKDIFGGGVG